MTLKGGDQKCKEIPPSLRATTKTLNVKGRTTYNLKMREKAHFRDTKLHSHNDVFFHGDFAFLMSYNDVCLHTVALFSCSDFLIRTFTQNCDCT